MDREDKIIISGAIAGILIAIGLFGVLFFYSRDSCHGRGGHLYYVYMGAICINGDGRIIE